ncbi:MAG TPA: kelch repeat-containing protein [Hanamia sp.]|nr:kelch repeat-containing protein [Hanamia sp.]
MYKKSIFLAAMSILGLLVFSMVLPSCKNNTTTTILGNWVTQSEFDGVARSEAVSFVIGDTAYIGTGFDGTNRLNDMWSFSPNAGATGYWFQEADFPGVPRSSAVAFALNGMGYVGTGYDGVNNLGDFWKFDPTMNTWTRVADFGGYARYDAVAFSVDGKGYVSTGYDGNYLKDFWEYNDTTNTWSQQVGMGGFKRSGAVAFVYKNQAYIVTGNNNGQTTTVNDLWRFDPTANPTWTALRDITNVSTDTYDDLYTDITRTNAVAFVMGAYAYITTGNNGSVMTSTWQYDIQHDQWYSKTAYEGLAREGAVGFTVDDTGYVGTGASGTQYFDDLRLFQPNAAYNSAD